ncbi:MULTISPECIES: hypothetical protein [unclassified Brevundimonas]|uniref:hypothetical protein n=1 Tax=unclassified Brevundimonas TaxID=2622653 RepID=UPI0025BEBADA|nr:MULTISPECIES: hypothetical protein [unclassified Brevundimonas]
MSSSSRVMAPETPWSRVKRFAIAASPALAVIIVCLAVALAFSLSLGPRALQLTQEGGPIEIATVVLYAAVLIAGLALWRRGIQAATLVSLAALLMGLREMDAHKAFTTYGVFKTRLYVSPDVPLLEKVLAGGAVLVLIILVGLAARSAWRSMRGRGSPAVLTLGALVAFGIFLKEMDGFPRKLADVGLMLEPAVLAVSKAVEETGELGLPVLLGLALWQLCQERRHA